MGKFLLAALLSSPLDLAQGPRVWAEPYLMGPFAAAVVEPPGGMPMDITEAELTTWRPSSQPNLVAHIRMMGVRRYALDGVTLRVAIGPTPDGMISMRMVPATKLRPDVSDALLRSGGAFIVFDRLAREQTPPPLIMRKDMRIVVTLEDVKSNTGEVMWTNPDALELLWDALGRPAGRRQ